MKRSFKEWVSFFLGSWGMNRGAGQINRVNRKICLFRARFIPREPIKRHAFLIHVYSLDLLLSIGRDGQLHTSIYDKRDDFNFHITNFPFLSSNIPSSPACGVFISQLIRYTRACSSYECFILSARRLYIKLLKQGYLAERLKSSFRKFYGRYGDLIQQYEVSLSRMLNDILILDQQWLPNQSDFPPIPWPLYRAWPSPIMSGFHGAFVTGVACLQGTLTLPDTWFRPPLLDLLVRHFWDQIPRTCHVFTRLFTSNTILYFLDFAFTMFPTSTIPEILRLTIYIQNSRVQGRK